MELDVSVQLRDQRWKSLLRPYCKTVRLACSEALAASKLSCIPCQWEMAVVLADDAFVRELNKTYRGFDKPTNVLSFPGEDYVIASTAKQSSPAKSRIAASAKKFAGPPRNEALSLGDVILALETVEREAEEQKKSFKHHAIHLLVHGALHLLGYDHEKDAEAKRMERMEIKILKKLDIGNPY